MSTFDGDRERRGVNVGQGERWISGIVGAALVGFSMGRKRLRAVLVPLGGALIGRAVTGRCEVNRMLGRNSASDQGRTGTIADLERGGGIKLEQAVVIKRPRDELFQFWRDFENLPRFMDNLESVTILGPRRSHWVAKGPAGTRVEWDAEIEQEIENELISWRSLPGADVDQVGSVHFSPVHNGGTEVRVILRYAPLAGKLGGSVGHVVGEDPEQQVADDLRRFKQVMDAREVPSPAV
jgi:uncharacterized membrane protein